MRYAILVLSVVGLASAGPLSRHHVAESGSHNLAPIYTPPNPWAATNSDIQSSSVFGSSSLAVDNIIPDSYIVVLKESHSHRLPFHLDHVRDFISTASTSRRRSLRDVGESFKHVVEDVKHHFDVGALKGYAGTFSEHTLEWIRRNPAVEFVERDSVVRAMDLEKGAPWGLARLSHRKPISFATFGKYEYEHEAGKGVDVYIIDTGINIKHVELEGRAKWGKTMPQNDVDEDGNGHGSHVAGTIGSNKYGVAKAANLIAVKVLGSSGSGSMSDVVGGVAWAASQAKAKVESQEAKNGTHKGSVANMSLGGGKSPSLDMAVNNAVKAGLHFAVAAGNDNRDACAYSPAAAENAITVGASTIGDARAYFSNYGKCVDIFAPGLNILSIWNTGNTSVNTISGTSMASPHIAGLAAYFLSLYGHEFEPTVEDYAAAGVPFPGSAADKASREQESSRFSNLWGKGRQLVFPGAWNKKEPSASLFKALDPKVLKKAMIRLSTKDVLSEIPSDTPNYLAFNNFTAPSTKLVETVEEVIEDQVVSYLPVFEKGEAMIEEAIDNLEDVIERVFAEEVAAWYAEQ